MGVTADHKEQRAGSAAEREGAEESADARSARLEWASQQTARNSRRDESPPVAVLCTAALPLGTTIRDSVTAPDKSLELSRRPASCLIGGGCLKIARVIASPSLVSDRGGCIKIAGVIAWLFCPAGEDGILSRAGHRVHSTAAAGGRLVYPVQQLHCTGGGAKDTTKPSCASSHATTPRDIECGRLGRGSEKGRAARWIPSPLLLLNLVGAENCLCFF